MRVVTPSDIEGIGHVCIDSYGTKIKLENFEESITDLNSSIPNNL
jgi:hypothetical protein